MIARPQDSKTRINEGIIILYSRAIRKRGIVIPIISRTQADAEYFFKSFCNHIVRQRIKHINRQLRIIELTNTSRFTFPVDGETND
jgi:hypothetical protein